MIPKEIYINPKKAKSVLSNITFKPEKTYTAHDTEQVGLVAYVLKEEYDKLKSKKTDNK